MSVHVLLDQGLPRDAARELASSGIACSHVGELGLARASDSEILVTARSLGAIVVTLDADFHSLLVREGAAEPSVIRIRIQGLNALRIADLVRQLLVSHAAELGQGCMITVKLRKTTCRFLTK